MAANGPPRLSKCIKLSISATSIDVAFLSRTLADMPTLEFLNLSNICIAADGAIGLAARLKNVPLLKALDLGNRQI